MPDRPDIPPDLRASWERLQARLRGLGSLMVAFSGGVDSSLLLAAAVMALGPERVRAGLCVGPLTPPWETEAARGLARSLGVELMEMDAGELGDAAIAANDPERCYHCKRRRLTLLTRLAQDMGMAAVAEGSQIDDKADHRPGSRAVAELKVLSPLMEAGLNKDGVRRLSRALGLKSAQAPSSACLATRVPLGVALTSEALARIGRAEADLRRLLPGRQVRLRDHFPLARLEAEPALLTDLAASPLRRMIVETLKQAGYTMVCLDMEGYRPSGAELLARTD